MSLVAWSWILALSGICGLTAIGKKIRWGWVWMLVNEGLWMTYAIATKQYGFIVGSILYAVTYYRGFIKWKEEK